MKEFLENKLKEQYKYDEDWTRWKYSDTTNLDALTDAWLENGTSYIYRVAVVAAIDANKCDWVDVAIGMQRSERSEPILLGILKFPEGENDDIARVISRAIKCMTLIDSVFELD